MKVSLLRWTPKHHQIYHFCANTFSRYLFQLRYASKYLLSSIKMKILASGGAGCIGSHIVELLHERAEVRVLDDLFSGFRHNLRGLCHEWHERSDLTSINGTVEK